MTKNIKIVSTHLGLPYGFPVLLRTFFANDFLRNFSLINENFFPASTIFTKNFLFFFHTYFTNESYIEFKFFILCSRLKIGRDILPPVYHYSQRGLLFARF